MLVVKGALAGPVGATHAQYRHARTVQTVANERPLHHFHDWYARLCF
jgi:hypothetical protein